MNENEGYSALFFNNHSVSLLIDPNTGNIVDANSAAITFYGYRKEELIGKGIYQINHLSRDKVIRDLLNATSEKEKHFYSTHYLSNGERRYVEVYSGPITVHGMALFYSIIHDITDRRLTEIALADSESRLQSIIQGSSIPTFVIDNNHQVLYWNIALEKYSGIHHSKVIGTNQQWRAFYNEERPCMADLLIDGAIEKIPQWYEGKFSSSKLIEGAYEATDFFLRMGKEGTWLYLTAAPLYDTAGAVIGAIETLEDITDRKKYENALKESESLLNEIVRGSPIPQFVIDRNHKIIYWNEALEKYSGINHTEVLGTNQQWRAFYNEERPCMADLLVDGAIEKIPQWYEGKFSNSKLIEGAYEATDFFPRMGDEGIWLYFTAAPIRDQTGTIIGAIETLEDISEQKNATEKLAQKARELARSNRELEQFAYIASHDLQEPLRMIGSYLQLIERRYKGRLDSDADEFIAFAVDGAQRLKNMINGLLEFSRVQTRGMPFQFISSEKILEDTLLNIKISIEETGAIITYDPLPVVMADPEQLIRVLQNLINNAIKFKGTEPPRIHISAICDGNYWKFSVKDNGIGFEQEYQDQLFILFRRLLGSAYPGTGIGLAVCKRIIERHDGKIWAESQPGTGSTFYFTIPVRGESLNE